MPHPLSPLSCCSFTPPAGRCGRCRPPKGRSQRIRHFCQSDFGEHRVGWGGDKGVMLGAVCPAQAAPHHPPCSLPSPDPGAALGGAGDALRGAGADSVPAPLPAGTPRVRLGARRLRLPPAAGGPRVPADGEAPRQLRAHPEPHPAAARRLRPPVVPPRGPAGAGGSAALRTATATLSPRTHRPGGGSETPGVAAGPRGSRGGRDPSSHAAGPLRPFARPWRGQRPRSPVPGTSLSSGVVWLQGGGGGGW